MIGSTVSHYRISGRLPGEGMGVYRARDLDGGGQALLCLFAPEHGRAEAVDRFRRAALDAANLGHPSIAPVLDLGETDDGRLFLALPALEGETLESRLGRGALLPVEAVRLAARLASGLGRAHEEGIVHGDLRPACVLVTGDGEARIFGFGLGELAAPGPPAEEGIAAYRAPERLRGEPPGPRSDVWSLGVVLYEMLAGRLPFGGDEDRERVESILHGSPEPLAETFPAGLGRVVARALARRPEDRYPNAVPMASDLLWCLESIAGLEDQAPATRLEIPVPYAGRRAPPAAERKPAASGELAGRDLPSYRVFERLGSGGMAVVYRAEDTRLGRPVALKFLAPELSRDPEAKARFLQEAKAASALDHPNLCTIHEVGETEDGQIFLAMPYYGGETLRERIDRGALPAEEALDVALQIALGLAKAHRHGIVHRDVKPANVILTPDGVVKILDFGLAKLVGSSGPHSEGPGAGTLAYLSPEQARGEDVDPRTDLWSVGVVLYEMLTGRKPFAADREQAVLYGILQGQAEPISRLLPGAPPELERIVSRLLAKDRAARYPDAETLVFDLRALRGPESLTPWPAFSRSLPRRRKWWGWAAAGAAAAAAGLMLLLAVARSGGEDGPVRSEFTVLTDQTGKETFPSVSPDGDVFVYVRESGGDFDVFWQRVGGGNPRNLTEDHPEDDSHPAISPDGQQIAFRSERDGGGLFLMGSTGESVRRLTDFGYHPAWSPDGREIVCSTEGVSVAGKRAMDSQLWRIDVATGARRLVARGDAVQPSWSPRGWRIAYWSILPGSSERVIWTLPAGGGEPVPAVQGASLSWNPVWSPDGEHLYFASNRGGSMNLWRVPIDEKSGKVRGQPRPMGAPVDSGGLISLSRDGRRLVFASEDDRSNLVRAELDPFLLKAGPIQAITEGSLAIRSGEVSPDGEWIVYDVSEPQEDLFLIRPEGGRARQLTNDLARDRVPRWSPDGRRILFYSDRDGGKYDAWAMELAGGALERLTAVPEKRIFEPLWSPDGRRLVASVDFRGPSLIDLGRPIGERTPLPLPAGPADQDFAATSWSADGDRLAGYDARSRLILYSFAAGCQEVLPERGEGPVWLRDGRGLLFLRAGAVHALDLRTQKARKVLDPPAGYTFTWLSVGPGDRTLYLVSSRNEGDVCMLTLE